MFSGLRIILFIVGLLYIQSADAQKHSITVFGAPLVTKTNFDPSQLTVDLYRYGPPNKPLIGHSYGLAYTFQPNKRYSLSLAFRNNHSGQQSSWIYDYNGSPHRDVFGGFRSQVLYFSSSLELGYDYYFTNTTKRKSAINIGFGLDYARRHFAQNFFTRRNNIWFSPDSRYAQRLGFSERGYFSALKFSLKESLYRYKISVGFKNEYKVYKPVYLVLHPEFTFLPPMIGEYILDKPLSSGSIFLFGIYLGLSYKF